MYIYRIRFVGGNIDKKHILVGHKEDIPIGELTSVIRRAETRTNSFTGFIAYLKIFGFVVFNFKYTIDAYLKYK